MTSDPPTQEPTPAEKDRQNAQSQASETPASESAPAATPRAEPAPENAEQAQESDQGSARPSDAAGANGEKPKRKRKRRRKKKPGATGEGAEEKPSAPPKPRRDKPATDRAPFHVGEEVFGKVTSVLETAVMVDLSGKALAIFDRSEMDPDDLVPAVGDRFVARVHQDGSRGGLVVLTRKPLREEDAKPVVEQAAKDGTLIQGLITGVIKGGVEVDIKGLRAFAPASGMDLHPQNANFTTLIGQVLDFKVVQFEKAGRDVVVTRRPMLEAEAHERRKKALELLQEGQVVKGVVRTIVDWGVFVAVPEAENLEGLVHVTEASHDPRPRLAELFKPGDSVELKIIKIDEKGKIWLSRKELIADPWGEAKAKHPPGSKSSGTVTRVEKFGVFVQLESGIEGLIHISDLAFNRSETPPYNPGDAIEVVVHQFDMRNHKIALHLAPPPEQANEEPQRVTKNAAVKVEVVRGEAAGVVVRLLGVTGRSARGFIPAGHTGTARGTDLRKRFKPGTIIDAKVIELDPRRGEPRLSIKLLAEDEERKAHRDYQKRLAKESSFGTLGDLLAAKLK